MNVLLDKVDELEVEIEKHVNQIEKEKAKLVGNQEVSKALLEEITSLKEGQQVLIDQNEAMHKEKIQLHIDIDSLNKKIDERDTLAKTLLSKLEEAEAETLEIKRQSAAVEEKRNETDKVDDAKEDLIASLQEIVATAKADLAVKVEEVGQLEEKVESLTKEIETKLKDNEKLLTKLEITAPAVDELEDTKKLLGEVKADTAAEFRRLTTKLETVEREKKGFQADLPRLQSQVESLTKQSEQLKVDIRTMRIGLEEAQKEAVDAKEERDTIQRQNDRNEAKLRQLESGVPLAATGSVDTMKLEKENDVLKAKLHRAQRELEQATNKQIEYKTLAEETDRERNERLAKNAIKLQALHRGGQGRNRAKKAKEIGYADLQAQDAAKAARASSQEAVELAEEERYRQRALKRNADKKAIRKFDILFSAKWNMLTSKVSPNQNVDSSMAEEISERIVVIKATAWGNKFLQG